MYRGLLFDKHGRVSSVISQSMPLPIPVSADLDVESCCLSEQGEIVLRGILHLQTEPAQQDGLIEIALRDTVVFRDVPGGTAVCNGSEPLAVFETKENFAFGSDMEGEFHLLFDSPRHMPVTVTVRVVARALSVAPDLAA